MTEQHDKSSPRISSGKRAEIIAASNNQPTNYGLHHLHADFMKNYSDGLQLTNMRENGYRRARFFHLVQFLRFTRGLDGATIEAGCFRGLSSFLICRELRTETPDFAGGSHFVVDSFEGLSVPVEEDGAFSARRHSQGAFCNTSVRTCRNTLQEFPDANIFKGWIPAVFSQLPEQKYRFAHIDVDIYEPTLAALEYFYPRLLPGGVILIDDYGPWPEGQWPGCAIAAKRFSESVNANLVVLDTGNAVLQKM